MTTLSPAPVLKRVFYVDVIRAYAILCVVASHVFASVVWGMNQYSLSIWWVFNLLDSIIRLCVPSFIMISGKLILGSSRDESYLEFVKKRYAKLVLPFFAWSMIYVFYQSRVEGAPYSAPRAVLQFLEGPTAGHLYFMYIILGIYLIAPLLRAFVRSATQRDLGILLALWMGFLTVQFIKPSYAGSGPGTTLLDYSGYFLLGYFLDHNPFFRGRIRTLLGISLGMVLINAYATYRLTIAGDGALDEKFYFGATPFVAVYSAAFFLALKYFPYDALLSDGSWIRRVIGVLSRESYNVYLNHVFFLALLGAKSFGFALSQDTGGSPLIGVPLTTAAVLACSVGVSLLLQKIPVISKVFVLSPP